MNINCGSKGASSGGGVGVRGSNKHFVSNQNIPRFPGDDDCDSVNNNNRSAEVLLFYSNNSLSTRNSVADFIENEEFNYKSLWGKDISEWDSRESRCNTLERENRANQTNYAKTGNSNKVKTVTNNIGSIKGTANESNQKDRLSAASSSPSLSIPTSQSKSSNTQKYNKSNNFSHNRAFDDDEEPLPSPPPTPPEAKLSLSTNSSLGNCSYFKYQQSDGEKICKKNTPFRIHSSTSTSSLSSSSIPTPDILDKDTNNVIQSQSKADVAECSTQTLSFWQLEFPGIFHCSCSQSSEDSGIVLSNSAIQPEESATLTTGGHESPGGDSSSGISSDDNLESLQTDEEIMLKSLKNSFLHQAIPFQLCSFRSSGSKDKDKPKSGVSGCANVTSANGSTNSSIVNECHSIITGFSSKSEKHRLHEHKHCKNHHHHQFGKDKCELSAESISPVTSQDRNRLGPVSKNYASSALDANANESEVPHLRSHGQTNGELEPSSKSCTKVPGSAEPLIDPATTTINSNNLIISKKSANNRISSNNQQNIQNSVLVQENSSLKEEVSRLTSVVADLQEQIGRLTATSEENRKALEGCLANADTRSIALSIVAQQCDKERLGVYEHLLQQQAENTVWKERLDEKLAELQKLQLEYEQEREQSKEEIRSMVAAHEVEVDVTVRNCENKLEQVQKRHGETLAELKRSHTEELEKLQESHRQELDVTVQKHRDLLDEHRNKSPHDILHKEVESLQVVVEMRNEEIRVLRKDLMDYKNTLNDLQMAREHGKTLLAKIEDLEAQLEKARADKRSLQERYQMLETNLQQIESENSRLVRCNDESNWKIKSFHLVEN